MKDVKAFKPAISPIHVRADALRRTPEQHRAVPEPLGEEERDLTAEEVRVIRGRLTAGFVPAMPTDD